MSDLLNKIGYDKLTPEEIQAMDSFAQLCLLMEIGQEIGRLTKLECDAVDVRFEAQSLYIDNPSSENKKLLEKAKATVSKLNHWIGARKIQQSGLQSNIKAQK